MSLTAALSSDQAQAFGDQQPPKAVVVFSGGRDRYQVPLALHEAGLLEGLTTDLHIRAGSRLDRVLARAAPRVASARRCAELSDVEVERVPLAAALSFAGRVSGNYSLVHRHDRKLGASARSRAARSGAALLAYSYYAATAFSPDRDRPSLRFLFQLHPHPEFMRQELQEELERTPEARFSLTREAELALPSGAFTELANEAGLANGWITASSFTARTLAAGGVPPQRIHVVPYGVDARTFPERASAPSEGPLTVLFVGSVIQRKGVGYLLRAVDRLGTRHVRPQLCGRGPVDRGLLRTLRHVAFELHGGLAARDLVQRLHSADVLVLPSLAEGFGHAILEAMSCGVPVITTPQTAGPDLLTDGVQGFLVEPRNVDQLSDRLEWCLGHRGDLAEMGRLAAQQARLFPWERFRTSIGAAYAQMVRDVRAAGVV